MAMPRSRSAIADAKWFAALRALVQHDDGKQLGALLRSAPSRTPPTVIYALAELIDPQIAWSPFVKPQLSDDQIQVVDGKRRLKVAINAEAAERAAEVESERLVKTHNERARGSGLKLEKWDRPALQTFAEKRNDNKALRAFADRRQAQFKLAKAKADINPAVRLSVKSLTAAHLKRLRRDQVILAEMLAAAEMGKTGAKAEIAQKYEVSERAIGYILAAAPSAMWPPR